MSNNEGNDEPDKVGKGNDRTYEVGYKKPPVGTQFKAGHPGRRSAKDAVRKSLPDEAHDRLERPVIVTENGKRRRAPSRRVVVRRLMSRALRGDARARGQIIQLAAQAESRSPRVRQSTRPRWGADRVEFYLKELFWGLVLVKACDLVCEADNKEQDEMGSHDRSTPPSPSPITPSLGSGEDRAVSDDSSDERPYAVGYKKPPLATRFKEGHRGHRRGKANGRKSLGEEVLDQLEELVAVVSNGKSRKIPNRTALLEGLMADVVRGEARALDQLIQLVKHVESLRPTTAEREAKQKKQDAFAALVIAAVNKTAVNMVSNATPDGLISARSRAKRYTTEDLRNEMTETRDRFDKYALDEAQAASEGRNLY